MFSEIVRNRFPITIIVTNFFQLEHIGNRRFSVTTSVISSITINTNRSPLKGKRVGRSKKMESLGILASGVVHDLNNVRSGIVIIGSFFNGFKILAAPCLKSLTGMMFAELTMTPPCCILGRIAN
jgi:hypothetical protein